MFSGKLATGPHDAGSFPSTLRLMGGAERTHCPSTTSLDDGGSSPSNPGKLLPHLGHLASLWGTKNPGRPFPPASETLTCQVPCCTVERKRERCGAAAEVPHPHSCRDLSERVGASSCSRDSTRGLLGCFRGMTGGEFLAGAADPPIVVVGLRQE